MQKGGKEPTARILTYAATTSPEVKRFTADWLLKSNLISPVKGVYFFPSVFKLCSAPLSHRLIFRGSRLVRRVYSAERHNLAAHPR
jgi:hypothetical protein